MTTLVDVKAEGETGTLTGETLGTVLNSLINQEIETVTLASQMVISGKHYHLTQDDGGATKGLYFTFGVLKVQVVAE
jgi:hypothetical protein